MAKRKRSRHVPELDRIAEEGDGNSNATAKSPFSVSVLLLAGICFLALGFYCNGSGGIEFREPVCIGLAMFMGWAFVAVLMLLGEV